MTIFVENFEVMKDLVIDVHKQTGGINFSFSPKVKRELSALFPGKPSLTHIFVFIEDRNWEVKDVYERVEKYFLPFLTGVEIAELANHFECIVFYAPFTRSVVYKTPLNAYVEESQLVSR